MARQLIEVASQLIKTQIQSNISSALASISSARGDNNVSTNPPVDYFFYEHSWAMQTPAVFIVGVRQDFRQAEKQANHINAKDTFNISVVIEDQTPELCVLKAWRYQAALHQVLDDSVLTSSDNSLRLVVVVKSAELSPIYSQAKDPLGTDGAFRRDIYLQCEVEHYENF